MFEHLQRLQNCNFGWSVSLLGASQRALSHSSALDSSSITSAGPSRALLSCPCPPAHRACPSQGPAHRQVSVGPGPGHTGWDGLCERWQGQGSSQEGMSRPREMLRQGEGAEESSAGAGGHCWCVGGAGHSWAQEHCPECPAVSALPSQAQHHSIFSCFCPALILSLLSAALREALAFAAAESGTALGIPARQGCPWEWGVQASLGPVGLWAKQSMGKGNELSPLPEIPSWAQPGISLLCPSKL